MKNSELFIKDPTTFTIPNDGYTTIHVPKSKQEWEVLEFELRSFVCEGEYHLGLERILTTFLNNLSNPKQPAVWIAGFYGSGKSHLARVLEYLWKDIQLPSGALASELVELPTSISDLFVELKNKGKQEGGLWSAAGTLSSAAGISVRIALLSIVFRAAGIPDDYRLARFVLWLKQNGYFNDVKKEVEELGKDFEREIRNLYVSPYIAKALLKVYPEFANTEADARNLFRSEYPTVEDISNDEFANVLEYVLELQSSKPGKLPLTLIVFDELQQFIGDDSNRAAMVQEAVQVCTSRFGSKILFLGTGQSALEADVNLSRLKDRFTVKIQLDDRDVEFVVRNVVLQKRADKIPFLKEILNKNKGEIDRHLQGTNIGPIAADDDVLVSDYPLLHTRRRFWEKALRVIDIAGTAAQLRTQLRVTHEATREVATRSVGNVVSADLIYWQQEPSMLQSGVLLRDVATKIRGLDDGTKDGKLSSQLCATIFLIGKFPKEGPTSTGIRANKDTLADLLVEDLNVDSSELRRKIPSLLNNLVEEGLLMVVDEDGEEYRFQTREGTEWDADFNQRYASIRDNSTRIASERSDFIKEEITKGLKSVVLVQGKSKTPRKLEYFFGLESPNRNTDNVPVWIRDEWNISEKTVKGDAQVGGINDPVIHVLLPKVDSDNLRINLARYLAANECYDTRANPTTPEGYEARMAMASKRDIAKQKLQDLFTTIVNKAAIFQGGGNLISTGSVAENVKEAAEASLARMFPNFDVADHGSWDMVVKRALEGNPAPLSALGFNDDADSHPVCKQIRSYIGAGGKKGNEIRVKFIGAGYGWPRDAVDGAILALLSGGYVRAVQSGQELSIKEVNTKQISSINFYNEGVTIKASERIAVRKLLTECKITHSNGNEIEAIPDLLAYFSELVKDAGGDTPLPNPPDFQVIESLRSLAGNERFLAIANKQQNLISLNAAWLDLKKKKENRLPRWRLLLEFLEYAKQLPIYLDISKQVEAIGKDRTLLSDPDPIKPLIDEITKYLRRSISDSIKQLNEVYQNELNELKKTKIWKALDTNQQDKILKEEKLSIPDITEISTDDDLLRVLSTNPLQSWQNQIESMAVRFEKARISAAKIIEPKVIQVMPKTATIKTNNDLDEYLKDLRSQVESILKRGNPVIITRNKENR